MTHRKVIVVGPRLVRDLVRTVLEGDPDITVIAELDDASLLGAGPGPADCVVAALECDGVDACAAYHEVFRMRPGTRVVGILNGGRRCVTCELVPHCTAIDEFSRDVLLRAVRAEERPSLGACDELR